MKLKASRHVRIGNKTFRRGSEVVGVSPAKARELREKGFLAGDVPQESRAEPLDNMTVAQLKALAEAEKIDLGDATKKADIVAAIELAQEAAD